MNCRLPSRTLQSHLCLPAGRPCKGFRGLHTSSLLCIEQAGRYKRTQYKTKPLTFEMANDPKTIGVHKSWNSWNTSNLQNVNDRNQVAQMTVWDEFIRRFLYGTWHNLFVSEIIIKRRYNAIYVAGIVQQSIAVRKMYFLIGYTEEFLSFLLKCPVKLEIQSVNSRKDVVYKYI
ncbi:28S ribosomal protein S24, mitochondrial-like [Paramacrobiotus metropolitanus]|uniref:28S ribosomal protein S24, mitochondrial-like n=1 Tax=Paramacrobiotus metropolitanus TaxID=2943436 RepID=UPI0024461A6A|nr:28S ribosomal protein S24, mitochondrial-like [Paramacrobiotus metropolitanus]